jgi:arsenite transporter
VSPLPHLQANRADTDRLTDRLLGRWQVVVYLAAILTGLAVGVRRPEAGTALEPLIWPALALLLWVTFLQVPLSGLPAALRDRRFLLAAVVGNFVIVPVLVAVLLQLAPADPAVRLGIALVLLVPCTDWFITFAQLGGGDARRAVVVTPLNLLVQFVTLPLYLWLLLGDTFTAIIDIERLAVVFVTLIVLPLTAAAAVQHRSRSRSRSARRLHHLERLPVPLLAVVLLLVAASQAPMLPALTAVLIGVLTVYVLFLAAALVLGRALGTVAGLDTAATRTLTFSLGSRNSFVVLPFALALPSAWQLAVGVIVLQSLVELFGMLVYLRLVPRLIRPRDHRTESR